MSRSGGLTITGLSTPADYGLSAWTIDPNLATGGQSDSAATGTLQLNRTGPLINPLIAFVSVFVSTIGATLTAGENFLGVYDTNGNLVATSADLTASVFVTAGAAKVAMVSPARCLTAECYVAKLFNGTTGPILKTAAAAGFQRINIPASGRIMNLAGPFTTLPASVSVAGAGVNGPMNLYGISAS